MLGSGYTNEPAPQGGGGSDMIGAAIQAGAMLYEGHENRQAQRENTDKTLAASKSEAELAYQRSVEMWNRQNLYNSPEAQMARFKAAGLNPHLIYGQGNSGNASSAPQYHPAELKYNYAPTNYGQAIGSILPTLMSVGTWMQDMRLKQLTLEKGQESIATGDLQQERLRQLIDFLQERNPKELEKLENSLSLFPYQKQLQRQVAQKAYLTVQDLEQDYRYKYGEDLFRAIGHEGTTPYDQIGGIRRLQFLEQQSKTKLAQAKASWSDFSITDPQAIMQLVLSGVMGMAGQQLRLSTHRRPNVETKEVYRYGSDGRINYRRRERK